MAATGTTAASATTTAGTLVFYRRASDWICVQDCVGPSPCGGLRYFWETDEFATRRECCATMTWDEDCLTRTVP